MLLRMFGGGHMELYLDLLKGYLNTGKLVKKQVQVHGKNGQVFNRMQWVSPDTGQPIHEHGVENQHDPHSSRIRSMTVANRMESVKAYAHDNPDRAKEFAKHTGISADREKSPEGLFHHLHDHMDKIPHEHIKGHMDHFAPEKDSSTAPVKLGLEHTDHGLSEEEVNHRHGRYGPLDMEKLTKGVPITQNSSVKSWLSDAQIRVNSAKSSKGKNINVEEHFHNIFGSVSREGLEHVFSTPGCQARLDSLDVYLEDDGNVWSDMGFHMLDEDDNSVASVARMVRRDSNGELHVVNHTLEVKSHAQNKGIADHIYARSEQLWRHLSGGHKVEIQVCANISVGTYAWAKKGFDFLGEDGGKYAKDDLKNFCKHNKVDLDELLDKNGYNSIDDIKHPWDYAVLDDGYEWDMNDLQGVNVRKYGKEWKGSGGFGKAFMLAGMSCWDGVRKLNIGSPEEKIYDPLEKHRGKTNGA